MARQTATPQAATSEGVAATAVASHADGHAFENDGRTVVVLDNGTAAPVNVTFQTARTVDGLAVPDRVIAVPAAGTVLVGALPDSVYNQTSGDDDGRVYVDFGTVDPLVTATYVR